MSVLNKVQRKELLRSLEHEARVTAELQKERKIGEDVSWQGIGPIILQLKEMSPFSEGYIWDVREIDGVLKLYLSTSNPSKPGYLHPGYELLPIDSDCLKAMVSSVAESKCSGLLPASPNMGLNGTSRSISLRNGFAIASFSWWEEGPPEWQRVIKEAHQMIAVFREASNGSATAGSSIQR